MSAKTEKRKRTEEREVVHAFNKRCITGLRQLVGKDMRNLRDNSPDYRLPCTTCAFRAATDSEPGMEKTVMGLLYAMLHDEPFYCHVSPVTGKPFPIVNGDYGVNQAYQDGEPLSECSAWKSICLRDKEDIYAIVWEAIANDADLGPIPRPIPEPMKDHIREITKIFVKAK